MSVVAAFIYGNGQRLREIDLAYPHSLDEHDRKPCKLCSQCLDTLARVYKTRGDANPALRAAR